MFVVFSERGCGPGSDVFLRNESMVGLNGRLMHGTGMPWGVRPVRPETLCLQGLKFAGLYDELSQDCKNAVEAGRQQKFKTLLERNAVVVTINGKPLRSLDLLALVGEMEKKGKKFGRILTGSMSGAVSTVFGAIIVSCGGPVLLPLAVFAGMFGLLSFVMAREFDPRDYNISSLDAGGLPASDLSSPLKDLAEAGLVSYDGGRITLTRTGWEVLKQYQRGEAITLQKPEEALASGSVAQPPSAVKVHVQRAFSYEGLSKPERVKVFKALLGRNSERNLSGFQLLETLDKLESGRSRLARYFSPGSAMKSDPWTDQQLEALQHCGLVERLGEETRRWGVTSQGKTVVKLGDPAFNDVMRPEDLHEMFQADIERLDQLKMAEYQQLEKLQDDLKTHLNIITALEAKIEKLKSTAPDDGDSLKLPASAQDSRLAGELALHHQWTEKLHGFVAHQKVVCQQTTERVDQVVMKLREGQLKIGFLGTRKNMAEILKSLDTLLDPSSEQLLAALDADLSGNASESLKLDALSQEASQLLRSLGKGESGIRQAEA